MNQETPQKILTSPLRVIRAEKFAHKEVTDRVVREEPLHIVLNGERLISLLVLPTMEKELVIGFLLSEGIIIDESDISKLEFEEKSRTFRVDACVQAEAVRSLTASRTLTTGCAGGATEVSIESPSGCKRINTMMRLPGRSIPRLMKEFEKRSRTFLETGGVHSSAAATADGILYFAEDVGRHNAFDKVIGLAALSGDSLVDKVILTTGRVSTEMIIKAIRGKSPILISRSAPTDRAVRLAEEYLVTVIGFARGSRFTLYSHPERIEWGDNE